jgi:hypothetical protein
VQMATQPSNRRDIGTPHQSGMRARPPQSGTAIGAVCQCCAVRVNESTVGLAR